MDDQQVSAAAEPIAVPSFADLVGETPVADASPQVDQQEAAPQVDWDAEKTRWEQTLADKEAALARTQAQLSQVQTAAQRLVAEEAAKQRQARQQQLARQLDQGDIGADQYRAEIEREVEAERQQLRQQFEAMSLPYMVRDYAQQAGLTPDEMGQLEGVPPAAVDWTIQRIIADRKTKTEWEQKFEQLQLSVQAQGIVQQGVTRSATGAASAGAQQYESGSLSHLRAALSELGHAELVGVRN